jgi:metallopeptidase MepB
MIGGVMPDTTDISVYSTDMSYNHLQGRPDEHSCQSQIPLRRRREKGGSQDEMKMLTDFLGREPKTDAFYKELGLA